MARSLCMLAGTLALGASLAQAAPTVDVLPAIGLDRDYMNLPAAFDAQPTWDGTKPVSASPDEYTSIWTDLGRRAFIDFGENWADLRITQTWTRYNDWSAGNMDLFQSLSWVETFDGWNWSTPILEPALKLSSQTAKPYSNEAIWLLDSDVTATPVTPQGRYLMLHTKDSGLGDIRASEFAFIGYHASAVPEPTTLGILGVGGLLLMKRRRA